MPFAYRCSRCGIEWPNQHAFRSCPSCGESCSLIANGKPLPAAEVKSMVAHLSFERMYEDRELAREGPTPEEIGVAEAREIHRLENIPVQDVVRRR